MGIVLDTCITFSNITIFTAWILCHPLVSSSFFSIMKFPCEGLPPPWLDLLLGFLLFLELLQIRWCSLILSKLVVSVWQVF